jgi:hypothetical protein
MGGVRRGVRDCVALRPAACRGVAAEGDRFDYWVDDGQREYGLEVSGTLTDDVEARHRVKVRQLLENPFGVDGFVVVVGLANRRAICSFHRIQERVP